MGRFAGFSSYPTRSVTQSDGWSDLLADLLQVDARQVTAQEAQMFSLDPIDEMSADQTLGEIMAQFRPEPSEKPRSGRERISRTGLDLMELA